jgi:alpha/beta superfamily hydrolase
VRDAASLAAARQGFTTRLVRYESAGVPMPTLPADLYHVVHYDSPAGSLAALLGSDPGDGKRHPALVWITGGDCNTIDDGIWKSLPADFDQTSRAAEAFRRAGIVLMFPTLRGGNDNPGHKEGLFGEVDDVLAAIDFIAGQSFVDPRRVYLGGFSTGGTLALLVAGSTDRCRAVFSFGPAHDVSGYDPALLPFDTSDPREVELRSPIHWLGGIRRKTVVFEGADGGNVESLLAMRRACRNEKVSFYLVKGAGHVTVLGPVAEVIASRIAADEGAESNIAFTSEELDRAFAR